MALSGRPRRAGPPSPSRPAGRSRPRGPEPLYTVRRDPDGHGALAAMGDARLLVTTALSGPGGDVPLRPDPTATTGGHASPAAPRLTRGCARATLSGCAPTRLRPSTPVPLVDAWVELLGPGPGRDVIDRTVPDGGEPITQGNCLWPNWAQQVYPGFEPGIRRGRTRSGARSTASVFCAGVLCGPCVAPLLPGGPVSLAARARSSRGAATGHRRGPAGRA